MNSKEAHVSDRTHEETLKAAETAAEAPAATEAAPQNVVAAATTDALDDIEGIDFLLEEIENKIAPLALA